MKKILSLFAFAGLIGGSITTIVSCGNKNNQENNPNKVALNKIKVWLGEEYSNDLVFVIAYIESVLYKIERFSNGKALVAKDIDIKSNMDDQYLIRVSMVKKIMLY